MSGLKYSPQRSSKRTTSIWLLPTLCFVCATTIAGPREQAKRMHDRLTGVPPTAEKLDQMETEINNNGLVAAARLAIEHPDFYNVTLKNWVTPWTNREKDAFAPLNDFTATVIGMIRDEDKPNAPRFNEVLSANILYVGPNNLGTPYSNSSNAHYEALEQLENLDLSDETVLQKTTQTQMGLVPSEYAAAGIVTTRAAARAFFIDGTNRRMFSYTVLNFLCRDLEEIKDPTRPTDRIRQDASRSPGGDSRVWFNNCLGCHAGMEPLAEAYAYYNFEYTEGNEDSGQLVYTPGQVQPKYLINSDNFKDGYATFDDSWINYWRDGPNSVLGWDVNNEGLPRSGTGAKSMGVELANSQAFAECQVTKAFEAICLRSPEDSADRTQIDTMTSNFKNGYNMKNVFAEAAAYCAGN